LFCDLACDVVVLQRLASLGGIANMVRLVARTALVRRSIARLTMEEHWQTGYNDVVDTLSCPEVLQRPEPSEGVRTFDLTRRDGN